MAFLRGGSGGTAHPTGVCEVCMGNAYGGKPYCVVHVDRMPYVAEVLAGMPKTPAEWAVDASEAQAALIDLVDDREVA